MSIEKVTFPREVEDIWEGKSDLAVDDEWRVVLAVECVKTFMEAFADFPVNGRIPQRVLTTFRESVALLQRFRDEGRLTSDESETLGKAEIVMAKLAARLRPY